MSDLHQQASWAERFAAFAAMKTATASRAMLPPYTTEFDRADHDLVRIGSPWSRRLFDGDFYASALPAEARPACSLVFVQSRDRNTVTSDPSRLGGGQMDKHVIYEGLSQIAADGVLAGSGTIGGGSIVFAVWHPELVALRAALGKPRYPAQIVATVRGLDLDRHLLFNVPAIPVFIVTVEAGAAAMRAALEARPWVRTIVMHAPHDLPGAFAELRRLEIERVSAVGGPQLASQLIDAGLAQDLYLTTSPRDGGEPGTPFYPRPLAGAAVVRKHGTGADRGVLFEHLRLP
jgi:riboflavin biosynthesis pyrimidine reductase